MLPLAVAAEKRDAAEVKRLLEAGADPNIRNKKGETALEYCENNPESIGGVEFNPDGTTTHWSGYEVNPEKVKLLKAAGGR